MNILLVLPAAEGYRVQLGGGKIPRRNMLRFSILPLTTVAALTPPGHEVSICDENVTALDFDADIDLVAVSFMTAVAPRAYEIAYEFRRRGTFTVAGGYHPTLVPGEAAEHFDAVVVGDAEQLWPRVLEDAEAGRLEPLYRHVCAPDLAETPPPRRDLMQATAGHYATTSAMQVGRGCIHGCRYCSITAFHGKRYRTKPLGNAIAEIGLMDREMIFVDDNIIADREYAKQLFAAMIPMRKRWVAQCSIEIAEDRELLRLAARAGCKGLFIGIETLSGENLEAVGKGFNGADTYRQKIRRIRGAGIAVTAGIIVGMDGDDTGVFRRMLRFLQQARIDAVQVNILTPLPGTPLHDDFEQAGRIRVRDRRAYDFRHVVIQPTRMSATELQDGADWLYRSYYRLDRILVRALRTLWTVGAIQALVILKLNLTYRYDNIREGIRGRDPGRTWIRRLFPVMPSFRRV